MDITQNYSNAFDYSKKLFSDFGRLVILIILSIIPLVNWIVVGYAARVLKESPGSEAPPKLENYGDMFVNGAKIFFASLIYMIIPIILIAAGVGSFVASMVMGGGPDFFMGGLAPAQMIAFAGTGLVLVILGIIVAFFMLIILAAGIAHMIKTGSFGKAFAFSEIFRVIGKIGWGRYVAWVILAAIIGGIICAVVGAIPYVGWLISAIIMPAVEVFFFRSLGILYSEGAP